MAKKRMPIYGIINILRAILAYNLAKYQYFSMRLGLFDKYHQIPYSLRFSVQYHVKCGKHRNAMFSFRVFDINTITKLTNTATLKVDYNSK